MKENRYDDIEFFNQYSGMARSIGGLEVAGEWPALNKLLPDFSGRRLLDLGCGFGWHCRYAIEHGAASAVGVDISERMLAEAEARTSSPLITYMRQPVEDTDFPPGGFDVILSSLVFHYVESFGDICEKASRWLIAGGDFIFTIEHPIFTAQGPQQWHCGEGGVRLHWPVDSYFSEGARTANFLGKKVVKYHRTLTTYINALLRAGFGITGLVEPQPAAETLSDPGMRDELRRPMMLIIAARKTS
jgi:SAM-dependent methyltransferase